MNGEMEDTKLTLRRLGGFQQLYSAILISKPKRSQQSQPHPHSLENGWTWMGHFLNLEPQKDISSIMLMEFLRMAGYELLRTYKCQFKKILMFISQVYLVDLAKVSVVL